MRSSKFWRSSLKHLRLIYLFTLVMIQPWGEFYSWNSWLTNQPVDHFCSPLLLPVSPLLDALGAFDGKIPPYAASVYLELHANASSSKEYNVKVGWHPDLKCWRFVLLILRKSNSSKYKLHILYQAFYRPDLTKPAKEVPLKRCKSNPCNFVDFMSSMEPYIVDDKEWQLECKAGPVSWN